MTQYPLGTSDQELERLRFQHEVWGPITRAFLARVGVAPGWKVLDLGCGPGLVTLDLAGMVGEEGEIVALDESPRWIEHVEREIRERRLSNVRAVRTRIQDADLPSETFDLVIARWVLSFLPEPANLVRRVSRALKQGGIFAVQDYNHDGVSLFPESEGFRAVVRATRAMYAQSGGDAWVAARAPAIFRQAGLETISIVPNVLCGGPGSDPFRWAGLFFPHFSGVMEEKGLLTSEERRRFLAEWSERERNPDAMFFSPIVVDAAGRKRTSFDSRS
jgi:ubiquinone/menaquinone biosynthesis C-methylase UbiE